MGKNSMLEDRLEFRTSRAKSDELRNEFLQGKFDLDELYALTKFRDQDFGYRASWIFNHIVEKNPILMEPFLDDILDWIGSSVSSTQRDILRAITKYGVPSNRQSEWYDLTLNFILDNTRDVAVKVHAMEIASRIVLLYPELKHEFLDVIDQYYEESSAAFKARVRHIHKKLAKI